jgi:hypothetical protein
MATRPLLSLNLLSTQQQLNPPTGAAQRESQRFGAKLGREPTNAEAKAECLRILKEAAIERAERGKLAHQR